MDEITSLCNDENKWVENIKRINFDEYTSDPQYWPKSALDNYLWFYSENIMCNFEINWSKERPETYMFRSIPYSIMFWEIVY